MKKLLAVLVLLATLVVAPSGLAQPQIPPAPSSSIYVQDHAGVLSGETEASINSLGSRLAASTKAQVVVLTVKSLEGANIEDYALAVLRGWGIGDKQLNNGVLLLVAANERQSRIEVGYGLEGRLPDAKTGRIQDEYMIPYFRQADYNAGVLQAYRVLIREVAAEYNVNINVGETKPSVQRRDAVPATGWDDLPFWVKSLIIVGAIGLLILDWVFFGGNITMLILSLILRRGGKGGGGGGGFGGGGGGGGGSSRRW